MCLDMAVCARFRWLWASASSLCTLSSIWWFSAAGKTGFCVFPASLYVARSRRVKPLSMQTRLKASPVVHHECLEPSTYWCAISWQRLRTHSPVMRFDQVDADGEPPVAAAFPPAHCLPNMIVHSLEAHSVVKIIEIYRLPVYVQPPDPRGFYFVVYVGHGNKRTLFPKKIYFSSIQLNKGYSATFVFTRKKHGEQCPYFEFPKD